MVVTTSDGCPIAFRELRAAPPGSPTVVLLHALAMDGSMWRRVADALQATARVIAIDCRGHGRSGKPDKPYTIELFARDLHDVLDVLEVPRLVLGGCSMGGTVAQAFAGLWPERVAGLLLVDTTAWYGAGAADAWAARASKALEEGISSLIPFQRERWFSPQFLAASPEVFQEAVEIFERNDVKAYARACTMLGAADERARIARYRGPATILAGEHDYATPPTMAQRIAELIPGARVRVLRGARHFTPYEIPGEIAPELDRLITRTMEEET